MPQLSRGGAFDVLLRDKNTPAGALTLLAQRLMTLLKPSGGRLILHDRADVALAVGAAGVHLPESGMTTADVRRIIGPHLLLGRSCHHSDCACLHLQQGGDYVTLSPVFKTASHPEVTPLGLKQFSHLCAAIPGPVLALGGIQADTVAVTLQAGASGVAVIRGILDTSDPAMAVRSMLTYINKT
ncbi:MAG: thiamine phosphate synthase [Magnetococcus sp. YQC-5]